MGDKSSTKETPRPRARAFHITPLPKRRVFDRLVPGNIFKAFAGYYIWNITALLNIASPLLSIYLKYIKANTDIIATASSPASVYIKYLQVHNNHIKLTKTYIPCY